MAKPFLLGVLGGMGPLATLDFQHKLLDATPAQSDQHHLPSVVWNVPQIADRQKALAGIGPSPLPQLLEGIKKLNQAGASHIAIPCNTAHHWYSQLSAASDAPILHIVDATLDALLTVAKKPERVGIIATKGTLDAGWYQQRLAAQGIESITPTEDELAEWFVPGCYAVKRGKLTEGGEMLSLQALALMARGAQQLVLACTEVPVALRAVDAPFLPLTYDPAQALAERCSRLWQDYRLTQQA
ncbi:amino acid racemase [Phytobacter palmae]|uniref:Amino acid racemase n=1 Tax=Phytobacter palmae TaxID=1855371 RepID=A0ABU9V5Z1_9ENTR